MTRYHVMGADDGGLVPSFDTYTKAVAEAGVRYAKSGRPSRIVLDLGSVKAEDIGRMAWDDPVVSAIFKTGHVAGWSEGWETYCKLHDDERETVMVTCATALGLDPGNLGDATPGTLVNELVKHCKQMQEDLVAALLDY